MCECCVCVWCVCVCVCVWEQRHIPGNSVSCPYKHLYSMYTFYHYLVPLTLIHLPRMANCALASPPLMAIDRKSVV